MSNCDAVVIVVDPSGGSRHGLECFEVNVSRTTGVATREGDAKYDPKNDLEEVTMTCNYIREFKEKVTETELLGVLVVSNMGLDAQYCRLGIEKAFPGLCVVLGMHKAKHGRAGTDWVLRLVEDYISLDPYLMLVTKR